VTNPLTRHPTVLAAAIYALDELTDARVLMGIGRGDLSVVLVGARPVSVAQLAEAVRTIRHLWAGHDVETSGGHTHLTYAGSSPRTIPVFLPGDGPKMLKQAGQLADGVFLPVGPRPEAIRSALAIVAEGARSAARNVEDIRVVARIPCYVSDEPDARRYVRSLVALRVTRTTPFGLNEEDLAAVEKIRRAYDHHQHLSPEAADADLVPDSLVDKFALAGRPEECLEKVRARTESGIDELNITLSGPDPSAVLRTFAREVMERL
jgi:5,10-methylenetetrahydromethanopterin reductase